MHWVFMCLERMGRKAELSQAGSLFTTKFGNTLPRSVRWRIDEARPKPAASALAAIKPSSIEGALADGWTIRKESGRQVILVKDRQSVTLYR